MTKEINFNDVPHGWALCFRNDCKNKNDCLRYQIGQVAPPHLTTAPCVLPQAYSSGECTEKRDVRKERLAWGFSHLFDKVRHNDYLAIRREMETHFGSRHIYYNYHRGFKKLHEDEQEWISSLLSNYGYREPAVFDHYEETYIFQ